MTQNDLLTILPILVLLAWSILTLLVDLFLPPARRGFTALLAALGLAVAIGADLAVAGLAGRLQPAFSGMAVFDGFAAFANLLVLASGLFGVALSYDFIRRTGIERGEYYVFLLLSTAGMMTMVQANDLILVFLALELLSIPLYVLAGFARPQGQALEAALKYFLLGAFASGFLLYGTALVYGASGTTALPGVIAAASSSGSSTAAAAAGPPILLLTGAALILIGLGFKISAVPFHMWTPDVYQGAPSPVTAWMSVAVKVAGLAALLRVFLTAFPGLTGVLQPVLWGLAALTMLAGNLLAIAQTNLKRLLAYSSIAHAGYLLMALVPLGSALAGGGSTSAAGGISAAGSISAAGAILFYLAGYALASFAAWGVVIAVEERECCGLDLQEYAGLGRKYPWLGLAMMAAMFSFTGIPLTLGFWGKFYVFQAALQGGAAGLAIIGVLTSLLSAYYYLRVLVVMYMRPGDPVARQDGWLNLVTIFSAAAVVLLAFAPGALFSLASQAVLRLP
jgi:NADH-quinone oxidoreductase subunit N